MGFLGDLFNKKKNSPHPAASVPSPKQPPKTQPNAAPEMIEVFDAYGRAMQITKEEWRTKVLPSTLKSAWNDAEQLYVILAGSLRDGFASDVLRTAEHFYELDKASSRSACVYGIALAHVGQVDEAEKFFRSHVSRQGEDGIVLTNLAKLIGQRGDNKTAEATLWHALEIDSNQEDGLFLYWGLHRDRGGDKGWRDALQRTAQLPKSWRSQVWIARGALDQKDLEAALRSYKIILETLDPVPSDVLMQISGDLGRSGHLKEIIAICAPRFVPKEHGLQVGNNLIKAYVDLGDHTKARAILEQLYQLQQPQWRENLQYWDTELAKVEHRYGPIQGSGKLSYRTFAIDTPLWAPEGQLQSQLVPQKTSDAVRVAFACGSADLPPEEHAGKATKQATNPPGRFSRGIPALLAEQVYLRTEAHSQLLVPYMESGGFILSGAPWGMDIIGSLETKPDYLAFLHLDASQAPWKAMISLRRVIDESVLWSFEQVVTPDDPTKGLEAIADFVLQKLEPLTGNLMPPSPMLQATLKGWPLSAYVYSLELTLAVLCAERNFAHGSTLYSERSIVDDLLKLAIEDPNSLPARMLLISTLRRLAVVRPSIVPEYRTRLMQLQREHPLSQLAHAYADNAIKQVYPDSGV